MTKLPLSLLKIILLILILQLTYLSFLVIPQSLHSDQEILLSINKQWSNQLSLKFLWDPTISPCRWPGIQCTGGNIVIGISLNTRNIVGEIPPSICNLKNLTHLDLGYNSISGHFPTFLYNCTNLQYLYLNHNSLAGKLPNDISNLSPQLQHLDLTYNFFSGDIPSSMGQLKGLITLNLGFNQFSGSIPQQLSALSNLVSLDLCGNKLSGQIPHELGQLRLSTLYLSHNNLSGKIPAAFDNVSYQNSFWDNNLCSDYQPLKLPRCSSHHFRYLLIILLLGVPILLVILYILLRKRKHETQQTEWIMTPFHNVDFTEAKIVSGLTEDNVIGSGGSGKIYCVSVDDSGHKIAVKRMWDNKKLSHTIEKQITVEAEILGKIRHINIIKLLCFVSGAGSKLLVYEYMEYQSLDKWLHRRQNTHELSAIRPILDWPTRLRIAIGAAKGLCYMHHDCSPPIIHRDVKSSNILLDLEFNAKIGDFGLAKMSTNQIGEPHTASTVAGSFGYIAPEYWRTRRISEKIDIYSFGVVLMELATGKEPCKGNDHLNLAEWSWKHYTKGHSMEDDLDSEIKEGCYLREMMNMLKVGLMCTSIVPSSRPSMKQVLKLLIESTYNEAYERTTH